MPTGFSPLHDYVLIRPLTPAAKTPGGLVLPEQSITRATRGIVIATGPGRVGDNGRVPMALKEGQKVAFPEFVGHDFEANDGVRYKFLRETDVLSVIVD